ncbi:MAG: dockerin type I domain-containing protein [Planctomycetota bacterium]
MKKITSVLTIGLFVFTAVENVIAEPTWTTNGDCMSCHTGVGTGFIEIFNHDGWADPEGIGPQKVFHIEHGQDKILSADLTGFTAGDKYAVELTQLKYNGVLNNGVLLYSEDCDWADWGGPADTYTDPAFYYEADTDPTIFQFDILIAGGASYDYYNLVFAVAGKDQNGELFYHEEPFYLHVIPPNTPPTLNSAISRKAHGSQGDFDINLPLDPSSAAIECRADGPTKVILTFSDNIQVNDGVPDCSEITLSSGSCDNVQIAGNVMTITITSVILNECLSITLNGVENIYGNPLAGNNDVHIRVIPGEVNGNLPVNIYDLGLVKFQLFKPITNNSFRCDVNADGLINIFDLGMVKSCLFGVPVLCP